jgi:hypothetical protein
MKKNNNNNNNSNTKERKIKRKEKERHKQTKLNHAPNQIKPTNQPTNHQGYQPHQPTKQQERKASKIIFVKYMQNCSLSGII